ncbi:amyloid beta A4 precursor protein-binding family B member 1-interacting protein-like [Thrips palmi]|uniref:Amyloid beta A4 precursor protein-binding family B member 1-interacting protein-like n=1 Tax=Thrips palmi TaxID=161013 RepID=A0A6P8YEC2_THRPL|nr:amyloid beta A4 precursor protein-binding family B member 1-interacting protein-like [Thrips palmi]
MSRCFYSREVWKGRVLDGTSSSESSDSAHDQDVDVIQLDVLAEDLMMEDPDKENRAPSPWEEEEKAQVSPPCEALDFMHAWLEQCRMPPPPPRDPGPGGPAVARKVPIKPLAPYKDDKVPTPWVGANAQDPLGLLTPVPTKSSTPRRKSSSVCTQTPVRRTKEKSTQTTGPATSAAVSLPSATSTAASPPVNLPSVVPLMSVRRPALVVPPRRIRVMPPSPSSMPRVRETVPVPYPHHWPRRAWPRYYSVRGPRPGSYWTVLDQPWAS